MRAAPRSRFRRCARPEMLGAGFLLLRLVRGAAAGAKTAALEPCGHDTRRPPIPVACYGKPVLPEQIQHWTTSEMRTTSAPEKPVDRSAFDAAEAFLKRLEGRYSVQFGILFGSRARASHHAESDADLAVVLAGASGDRRSASRDMAGIAFDVLMETGVLVDPLPLWEDKLERRAAFSNPALIDAIWRDGIRLSHPRPSCVWRSEPWRALACFSMMVMPRVPATARTMRCSTLPVPR
jgi:uncharacterized protein